MGWGIGKGYISSRIHNDPMTEDVGQSAQLRENCCLAEPLLEQPSQFLETLDKLQEFKRFFIALVFLGIFGAAILAFIVIISVMVYRGQYDSAVEAAKWLIAIVGTTVGAIVGFYFGNNQAAFQKG